MILVASTIAFLAGAALLVPWPPVAALGGLWLVVKDWPDLFPATRDTASWRLGVHRLPREGSVPCAADVADDDRHGRSV